jgi:hypothetical protein
MESVTERMGRFAQNHREDIATFIGGGIAKVSSLGAGNRDPSYQSCNA